MCFRALTRLNLRDMQLLGEDHHVLPPACLLDLRMYNVRVQCCFFQEMIKYTKRIKSLRMNDSSTYYLNRFMDPPKSWSFKLTDAALTNLERQEADPNATHPGKKSFSHETGGLVNAVYQCKTLEHLELGAPTQNDAYYTHSEMYLDIFKRSTKLRTLKLKDWWPVDHYPRTLEHLTVTGLVDPKHKQAIDALQLKTTNVQYFHPPTQPKLLLKTLNNDCLEHLLRFLSLSDCLAFAETDWRVRDVMVRYRFPTFSMSTQVEAILSGYPGYLSDMAPFIRKLSLFHVTPQLTNGLAHFTSLRWLCMTWVTISDQTMMDIPQTVQKVSMSGCSRQKSTTEKRKSLRGYQQKALGQLREITVDSRLDDGCLAEFLHYGRNSLQRLNVRMQQSSDLESYADVWPIVAAIPTMQHLMLQRLYGPTTDRYGVVENKLERDRMGLMYKAVGGKLLKLHVDIRSDELVCFLNATLFGELEELQLTSDYHARLGVSAWKSVYTLKNLRKFRMGKWGKFSPKVSEQEVLRLVRQLPKLQQLEVPAFHPSAKFGRELKALLDEERRTLKIFSCKWIRGSDGG